MNPIFLNTGLYVFLSGIVGVVIYVFKNMQEEISVLRDEMKTKMTESETRQILSDKLEPIKENLINIQDKVDKIVEFLIHKKD